MLPESFLGPRVDHKNLAMKTALLDSLPHELEIVCCDCIEREERREHRDGVGPQLGHFDAVADGAVAVPLRIVE